MRDNSGKGATGGPAAGRNLAARPDYSAWYATGPGSLALAAQLALLRRMTATWPRRGNNLLEMGCASGLFLENLWEAGFDVSGQEGDQALARRARERLGNRAELVLGSQEHLPFDDQSFDYVVCLNNLEFAADPFPILREALRLASRGLLLAFPGSFSLRGLARLTRLERLPRSGERALPEYLRAASLISPLKIWNFLRREGPPAAFTWAATLPGPFCSWKNSGFWRRLNLAQFSWPLGGWVMLRLDLQAAYAATPLLINGKKKATASTALVNKEVLP